MYQYSHIHVMRHHEYPLYVIQYNVGLLSLIPWCQGLPAAENFEKLVGHP